MSDECKKIIEVAEGPSLCAASEHTHAHGFAAQQESAYGIKVWIQKQY